MHVATRRKLSSSARSCARTRPCVKDGDGQISSRECARLMSLFLSLMRPMTFVARVYYTVVVVTLITSLDATLCVTGSQLIPKLISFGRDGRLGFITDIVGNLHGWTIICNSFHIYIYI